MISRTIRHWALNKMKCQKQGTKNANSTRNCLMYSVQNIKSKRLQECTQMLYSKRQTNHVFGRLQSFPD